MSATPVGFHHADPGTPESAWLGSDRWDAVPVLDLAAVVERHRDVLVVSAHPDDETLGVGGILSDLSHAGARVQVLVATDGERSHPVGGGRARAELGERRRREVERAVDVLARTATVTHLGLPDGELDRHAATLVEQVRRRTGTDTLVLAPWVADGHRDHDALGRACVEAVSSIGGHLAHYPIWLWHWGTPDALPWPDVVASETSMASSWRKRRALEEFPSQTTAWTNGPESGGAPVLGTASLDRARRLVETLIDPDHVLPRRPTAWGSATRPVADSSSTGCLTVATTPGRSPAPSTRSGAGRSSSPCSGAAATVARWRSAAPTVASPRRSSSAATTSSPSTPATARWRLRGRAHRNATIVHGVAPADLPRGPHDLVVLSEVGYFLTPLELLTTLRRLEASLAPGGEVLLCHWQHPTERVPLDGVLVHDQAATALRSACRARYVDRDLRIEVWGGAASVAQQEGRA